MFRNESDCYLCSEAVPIYMHYDYVPQRARSIMGHSNLKLISIPLVFIFLRMWSTLVACIYFYPHTIDNDDNVPVGLQYLSVSEGTTVHAELKCSNLRAHLSSPLPLIHTHLTSVYTPLHRS